MLNEKWDNDRDISNCTNCNDKFNLLLRKHHCRKCGKIFCGSCLKEFYMFNLAHKVCSNCLYDLRNSLIVDKNELCRFYGELEMYREMYKKQQEKKYVNNSTQTLIETNSNSTQTNTISQNIYTQTNQINILDNSTQTTEKIDEFKSKSLDILECINTVSKKNPVITPQEKEILKYQENKNKRYYESLKEKELLLKTKEKELTQQKKLYDDLLKKEQDKMLKQEQDKILKQKQEQDKILKQKQEQDRILKQKQEQDRILKQKQELDKMLKQKQDKMLKQEQDKMLKQEQDKMLKQKQNDFLKQEEKKIEKILSTRDAVLKRKIDKKKAEEEKYMNELKNIQNNYKNDIKDSINYKF